MTAGYQVQNLSIHIGGRCIVDDIGFTLAPGEIVALAGASGAGKSMTAMTPFGLSAGVASGSAVLDGVELVGFSEHELSRVRAAKIGFVFQQFNLLPRLTAAENVALPLVYAGVSKKDRMERAMEALKKVGLADRSHHKSNELSGGQIQRVAIARAVVNNPSLLLADEPTGNLDSKTSVEVMEIFAQIQSSGNTVVLVTHEEDIAAYAHRVVRLRDGLVETDTSKVQSSSLV